MIKQIGLQLCGLLTPLSPISLINYTNKIIIQITIIIIIIIIIINIIIIIVIIIIIISCLVHWLVSLRCCLAQGASHNPWKKDPEISTPYSRTD